MKVPLKYVYLLTITQKKNKEEKEKKKKKTEQTKKNGKEKIEMIYKSMEWIVEELVDFLVLVFVLVSV